MCFKTLILFLLSYQLLGSEQNTITLSINDQYLVVPCIKALIMGAMQKNNSVLNDVQSRLVLSLNAPDKTVTSGGEMYLVDRLKQEQNAHKEVQQLLTKFKLISRVLPVEVFYEIIKKEIQEMYEKHDIWHNKLLNIDDFNCSHYFLYTYLKKFNISKQTDNYLLSLKNTLVEVPVELNSYIYAFLFLQDAVRKDSCFLKNVSLCIDDKNNHCAGIYKFLWFSGFKFKEIFWDNQNNILINYKDVIINENSLNVHNNHDKNCVFCNRYWIDQDTAMIKEYEQSISG